MAQRTNTVTGIAFNKDAICLAQFAPEERLVANISIQPIEEPGDNMWELAGTPLKELVRTVKLAGENVISSLPGEYAVIRTLCLDQDEPNVEEALEWEFSQHIIGSRDEYIFDFERLASGPQEGMGRFLAVGYRSEAVDRLARLLRSNRLNPIVVDLDIFALVNVHEANYGEAGTAPALLVLADERLSKCVLAAGGSFVDLETFDHAVLEDRSSQAYAAAVENAAAKLLACNPGAASRETLPVLLTGGFFSQAEFADEVIQGIRNAEVLYPFRKIGCGTGMAEEELRKYSPQLAVAVGLALRGIE